MAFEAAGSVACIKSWRHPLAQFMIPMDWLMILASTRSQPHPRAIYCHPKALSACARKAILGSQCRSPKSRLDHNGSVDVIGGGIGCGGGEGILIAYVIRGTEVE